jgi:6-phosphofructokinase 1
MTFDGEAVRRIAVLTSGGDAPGMNAAIRSATRTALHRGWEVLGVRSGFQGLLDGRLEPLGWASVGGIIETGGTMLGSSRCEDFVTEDGRRQALHRLYDESVDGLVVIGGNGSQRGAYALSEMGFPVVGVASTIDNDLWGSDMTIGCDSALNVAVEAIDRLRTTAFSHRRISLVEVMGRDSGYLALMAGLAGGAEAIVVPEAPLDVDDLVARVAVAHGRKQHALVVVAEGAPPGAAALAGLFEDLAERQDIEVRVTVLGHIQRGGQPSAWDRLLGTRLGEAATEALARGTHGVLAGWEAGETTLTSLSEVCHRTRTLDARLLALADVLAG